MSIKKKLWIVIILSFIINCTIILAYYKYNIHEKVENEINIIQQIIDEDVEYLSEQIEKNQSLEEVENFINSLEKKKV